MKTGTITFHAPNNNGSFLQAYALQQILVKELGVDNEIIDFRSVKQTNQYKTFRPVRCKNDLLKNLASLPHCRKLNIRYARFEEMRNRYLMKTECIVSEEDALKQASKYDVLIAGSDQIWNTGAPDFSPAYFLPNVDKRKIAYAVSCGSVAGSAGLKEYEGAISAFEGISVREEAVKKQLQSIYSDEIGVVLDPTLLLNEADYQSLYQKAPLVEGDYIFYYSITYSKDSLKAVQKLSEKTGLPVYTVFTSFHTSLSERYGVKVLYNGGPSEFLNLLAHAKIVATNSFHGTAFSLIFHKNFYHLCDMEGEKMKKDDRIDGILERLGLASRNYCYQQEELLPDLTYEKADIQMQQLRKESLEWLRAALGC